MLDETRAPLEVVPVMLAPFSKPGAPIKVETRELAITAVEAKQTDPNFSWQKFANQHCRCGKSKHDINCKERIRQAAMELQALLKRLNLEV